MKSKSNRCPVIWRSAHDQSKKRWRNWFLLTQSFYLILIAFVGWLLLHEVNIRKTFIHQKQELEELKTKEIIYSTLRSKGISLGQGLDIAEVTIQQSKKLDLPVSLILAVMKKESTFIPFALSPKNAMGLMQIHPTTWDWFLKRLDLKLSVHAAFDPATNIIMGTHILRDLYVHYRKTSESESEIWQSALSAYYAGLNSFSQTGITQSHVRYVADVTKFKKEFDEKLQN